MSVYNAPSRITSSFNPLFFTSDSNDGGSSVSSEAILNNAKIYTNSKIDELLGPESSQLLDTFTELKVALNNNPNAIVETNNKITDVSNAVISLSSTVNSKVSVSETRNVAISSNLPLTLTKPTRSNINLRFKTNTGESVDDVTYLDIKQCVANSLSKNIFRGDNVIEWNDTQGANSSNASSGLIFQEANTDRIGVKIDPLFFMIGKRDFSFIDSSNNVQIIETADLKEINNIKANKDDVDAYKLFNNTTTTNINNVLIGHNGAIVANTATNTSNTTRLNNVDTSLNNIQSSLINTISDVSSHKIDISNHTTRLNNHDTSLNSIQTSLLSTISDVSSHKIDISNHTMRLNGLDISVNSINTTLQNTDFYKFDYFDVSNGLDDFLNPIETLFIRDISSTYYDNTKRYKNCTYIQGDLAVKRLINHDYAMIKNRVPTFISDWLYVANGFRQTVINHNLNTFIPFQYSIYFIKDPTMLSTATSNPPFFPSDISQNVQTIFPYFIGDRLINDWRAVGEQLNQQQALADPRYGSQFISDITASNKQLNMDYGYCMQVFNRNTVKLLWATHICEIPNNACNAFEYHTTGYIKFIIW